MNKKGDTNKIDDLCFRLFLTKDFKKKLEKIRRICGIPVGGFSNEDNYKKWLVNTPEQVRGVVWESAKIWTVKNKFPPDAKVQIENYILFDKNELRNLRFPKKELQVCDVELFDDSHIEDIWRKTRVPFVKIIISDWASQADVHSFIESQWNTIEMHLSWRRKEGKKPAVRSIRKRALQERVMDLNKLSLKEINKIGQERVANYVDKEYKYDAIAAILSSEGYVIGSSGVKKIISRRSH